MPETAIVLSSNDQVKFESDCACPAQGIQDLKRVVFSHDVQTYRTNPRLHRKSILPGFTYYYDSTDPTGVIILNPVAEQILSKFEEPTTINEAAKFGPSPNEEYNIISELARHRLIVAQEEPTVHPKKDNEELNVWLHVTNQCNLRCDYCFVDKTIARMDNSTAQRSVNSVFRSANLSGFAKIKLKYAGGEPTLNFKVVQFAHEYAQSRSVDTGIDLEEVILSNATLLKPAMVDYLKQNDIRLMISLDGFQETNDVQRHTLSGKGSFASVEKGLDLLQKRGLQPTISITITNRNHQGLPRLTQWLLQRGLPFTFNFYRENQYTDHLQDLTYSESEIISSLFLAFSEIENNPPAYSILGMLSDRARLDSSHEHACGAGNSYIVIDHIGRISKCHMLLNKPITSVNVENPLQVIRQDLTTLQNPKVDSKEGCQQCEWRYVCAGGCPALTYKLTGRFDIQSPNCAIYKAIFPRILELEAIRLLKMAHYC